MAKIAPAFFDNQGRHHDTPEQAVLADLTMILGRIGAESAMTAGLAKCIIEKRAEIEQCFADLDAMSIEKQQRKAEIKETLRWMGGGSVTLA